jgi:oligopeptide/dipeptide ABC transporter ATP-binding protein
LTEPLLEVDELSVRFESDEGTVHAVDLMSLRLEPRQVLGIVGESGCGKSVTALSILRLLPPAAKISGTVRFEGVDLLRASRSHLRKVRGRKISFVFQEPMTSLNPAFRVGHQIGEVLREHLGLSRGAARERAVELLELVHIPDAGRRVDEYPHQLSGGMRQRVMIAMALACDPRILIADPQHPYTIGLLGAIPRPGAVRDGKLQEIPGRVPSLAELPGHCAFADRCPRADELSWSEVPRLREVRPDHAVACFHPGR